MAKERGWHCAFTHACIFESGGEPVRTPGTNITYCGPHAAMVSLFQSTGGRASASSSEPVSGRRGAARIRGAAGMEA